MALRSEPVEDASHVQFLAGGHVQQRKVHGRAAGVAALFHDIFLFEQDALVKVRVEGLFHQGVSPVGGPADEVVHGPLRPVGIVDLEPVALAHDVVAHRLEAVCSLACQHRSRGEVSVDPLPYEVVGAEVPDLQDGVRDGFCDEDEMLPPVSGVAAVATGFLRPSGEGKHGQQQCRQDCLEWSHVKILLMIVRGGTDCAGGSSPLAVNPDSGQAKIQIKVVIFVRTGRRRKLQSRVGAVQSRQIFVRTGRWRKLRSKPDRNRTVKTTAGSCYR